jgi:hypothetical protein
MRQPDSVTADFELQCAKCGYPLGSVRLRGDMLVPLGMRVVTDLEDEVRAQQEGREYHRPPWKEETRFTHRCRGCPSDHDIRWVTLTRLAKDALARGESSVRVD